jgi:GR25 family glycosyltransferase involved in LPS biosynthesis
MKGYVIQSIHEPGRENNVRRLCAQLPGIKRVEALYPAFEKVPFLERMIAVSKVRTGAALKPGEIGCLMSHRRIWKDIVKHAGNEHEHYLVTESDSTINDIGVLTAHWQGMQDLYDLFFWGAWDGHMQLFRSGKKSLAKNYAYGVPFIRSVYCTYGYSLNAKAARCLLRQTARVHYPVDQFKHFLSPGMLAIGGVMPELISTAGADSYIREDPKRSWYGRLFVAILDIKNSIICTFR